MSTNQSDSSAEAQAGLSHATAMRDCFVCGVVLVDDANKIALLSPEAGKLLGLNPAQALGAGLEVLPAPLQQVISETVSTGKPLAGRKLELGKPGGAPLSVRVTAAPQFSAQRPCGVALALQDLTAAGEVEQRIRQLDRLADLGTLAAGMAHEIKNALVAGKTFIDLLLEKNQEAELVTVVRRELGRIDALVSRMLKFAAPDPTEWRAVSLHAVLEHALRLLQPQLKAKTIVLNRSFEARPDRVHGDEYELEQAVVNLLLNALEAMGPNGTLTVATSLDDRARSADDRPATTPPVLRETAEVEKLRILIQDTGAGIPPEIMPRLFEPFFTTKPSGTGLGLAITRRILQEHGGNITVTSQAGEGTTFQILLPAIGTESNQ